MVGAICVRLRCANRRSQSRSMRIDQLDLRNSGDLGLQELPFGGGAELP